MGRCLDNLLLLVAAGVLASPAWITAQEPARNDVTPVNNGIPPVSPALLPVPGPPQPGSLPLDPARPAGGTSVSVETIGPLTVPTGQPLPFEVVVRNTGALPAVQVRVELPVPPGARFLAGTPAPEIQGDRVVWAVGKLEPGAEQRCKGEMQPPADGGDVDLRPSVNYAATSGLRARVVRPAFSVALTGPETAQRGQPVAFRLQVTNSGPDRLSEVVARIKLPAGFRHPAGGEIETDVGELAPGQTRSLNLEAAATKTGQFVLEASAQAHEGQRAQGRAVLIVSENTLGLRVEGPGSSGVGEDVDLRLDVANSGTVPAPNARVSLRLPEGIDFVSASGGGKFDPMLRAVAWALPALPAGSGAPLAVQVRPREAGQWTTQAVAAAEGYPEARADCLVRAVNIVRAESPVRPPEPPVRLLEAPGRSTEPPARAPEPPELLLEMSGPSQGVEMGQEGMLEVRLLNKGSEAADNVRLHAQLPDGLLPVRAEGPMHARIDGQQVDFEPVGQLEARAEAIFRIRVRGAKAGHRQVVASATADFLPQPIVEQLSAEVIDGP